MSLVEAMAARVERGFLKAGKSQAAKVFEGSGASPYTTVYSHVMVQRPCGRRVAPEKAVNDLAPPVKHA